MMHFSHKGSDSALAPSAIFVKCHHFLDYAPAKYIVEPAAVDSASNPLFIFKVPKHLTTASLIP